MISGKESEHENSIRAVDFTVVVDRNNGMRWWFADTLLSHSELHGIREVGRTVAVVERGKLL
jgi:hypothetical protein